MRPAGVASYQRTFESTWSDDESPDRIRFVVLDSETTGLDARNDRIVTIGAVAVQMGEIVLPDSFSALVKVEENTSAVEVHGVTRDESRRGLDEPIALEQFLEYLRDGVIVGHHIGHDIGVFNAALGRHWGIQLLNRSLDTMDLTLHLERNGALAGRPPIRRFTLDALCEMFGVVPHDRHTASGDAFITAQVFLRLLKLAERHDRKTLAAIAQPFVEAAGPGV
ncbi:MAG: PolC-type DNA polymerase III [Vicinamibacterales bacterium]